MVVFSKIKGILSALLFAALIIVPQIGIVLSADGVCEDIEVDKSRPIYRKKFDNEENIKYNIQKIKKNKNITLDKAKGFLGEAVAKYVMENKLFWHERKLVSITTMFRDKECKIQKYLRDNADRGIDDIFVVLRADGWIDRNFNPVFHEAKFAKNCELKLNNTVTLCKQLSIQWLSGNLEKVYKRTSIANLCLGSKGLVAKSCHDCKEEFQENVEWLKEMLTKGRFYRTASVLCEDGTLSVYQVNGR